MKLEDIIKIRLNFAGVEPSKMEEKGLEGACWPGYEAIGLKDDGSPNCVPIKAKKEDFVIPEPKGGENEQDYVSRCIAAIYDEYGQEQSAAICYEKWRNK